jgi:hypothetical protein
MSETELVERLERLERAHRRLKGFALAAIVLATALATIYATQPVPQIITAHGFDLLDKSGKVRIMLNTMTDSPVIAILDAEGKTRASMGIDGPRGPVIEFDDAQSTARARIQLASSGEPSISLSDANGNRRAILTVFKGSPYLWLSDEKEKNRCELSVYADRPNLTLSDLQGFEMRLGL